MVEEEISNALLTQPSSPPPPPPQHRSSKNLFDYTEEELYCSHTNSNNSTHSSSSNSNNNNKSTKSKGVLFNHYELLQIPIHATSLDIKKSYRKLSLQYHPDKTGRDENDYVFLAIKHAYDTLMDPIKRNGYDSTVLTFDDSIPPSRSTLIGSDGIPTTNTNTTTTTTNTLTTNYTDDDFYDLYGPVFTRNLRFDARLRPELSSNNSSNNSNSSNSINGSKTKNNNNNHPTKSTTTIPTPPTLGDATTPLDQVHLFYDYWIHFTSWRDFSLQATTELELSDTIEQSESRYEKRYYQKEIDKRTKQLKRQEMIRIQTLVERAMEADPRLRQERQEQLLAKNRIREEKRLEQIRIEKEQQQQIQRQQQQEEEMKVQKQQEKIQREQYKKLLRKSKQTLRKMVTASYDHIVFLHQQQQQQQQLSPPPLVEDDNHPNTTKTNDEEEDESLLLSSLLLWNDAYDLNQDIDYLGTRLTLEEINALMEQLQEYKNTTPVMTTIDTDTPATTTTADTIQNHNNNNNIHNTNDNDDEYSGNHGLILEFVHQHVQEQKVKEQQDNTDNAVVKINTTATNTTNVWTTTELSTLIKAMKKYPMGGAGRWDAICNMINHTCSLAVPRTRQECIDKYNRILKTQQQQQQNGKNNKNANTETVATTSKPSTTSPNDTDHTKKTNGNTEPSSVVGGVAAAKNTTTVSQTNGSTANENGTVSLLKPPSQNDDTQVANGTTVNGNTTTPTSTTPMAAANDTDVWSTEQDRLLQEALLLYPASLEKNERWSLIASYIPNKNKKACVQRFKTIRQEILSSQAPSSTSN